MLLKKYLCAALAALLVLPGAAAAGWYQVEVVVFRHLQGLSAGGEAWPELTDLPEFGRAMELIIDLPEMSDEPPPLTAGSEAGPTPIAFELL
ncbi:MAG: CsiV family protein, partial [Gammaproteobacteria bacterium]